MQAVKCGDYFQAEDGPREFGNISIVTKWIQTTETSLILRCIEVKNKKVWHSSNPTQSADKRTFMRTLCRVVYNPCMFRFSQKSHHFLFCTFCIPTGQIMEFLKTLLLFVKFSKEHQLLRIVLGQLSSTAGLYSTVTYNVIIRSIALYVV